MEPLLTDTVITGTISAKHKIDMSFDQDSLEHIMSVLTDLYSDPEMAVIREYSTNAIDAQIEAGYDGPIEVSLPGPLSNVLEIRDYGVGMSVEDIMRIYSKYGASTKRGTNDQTGMLGLGCKSALTYSSQFTLISVKDGRQIQALISRNERGSGSIQIVSDKETDEPNGTTIRIIAKRDNDFESKARFFFSFWEKGEVLIDGVEPKSIYAVDPIVVSDDASIFSFERKYEYLLSSKVYILMGRVAYPISNSLISKYFKSYTSVLRNSYNSPDSTLILRVPIGTIGFAPSRESLLETSNTEKVLSFLAEDFNTAFAQYLQSIIESVGDNDLIRYLKYIELEQMFYLRTQYISVEPPPEIEDLRNIVVKYAFEIEKGSYLSKRIQKIYDYVNFTKIIYRQYSKSRYKNNNFDKIVEDAFANILLVTDFTLKVFREDHYDKLSMYLTQKGKLVPDNIIIINFEDSKSGLKDYPELLKEHLQTISFEDFRNLKLSKKEKTSSNKKTEAPYKAYSNKKYYEGHRLYSGSLTPSELEEYDTVWYVDTGQDYHLGAYVQFLNKQELVKLFGGKIAIVTFPSNRRDKFLRLFPEARDFIKEFKEAVEEVMSSLTEDEKYFLYYADNKEHQYLNIFSSLEKKDLLDDDIINICRLKSHKMNRAIEYITQLSYITTKASKTDEENKTLLEVLSLMERYPLIGLLFTQYPSVYDRKKITDYLNMKYIFESKI